MLFRKGDSSNLEYKRRFKDKIELFEAYNGLTLFQNIPGETAREIKLLGMDADSKYGVEKARTLARVKYIATAFLLISDRRQYREWKLDLKNCYTKQ